jgi:hypothetical protein
MIVVRFADDHVVGFQQKKDAQQMLTQLQKRLAQFGLELHSGKTRLIEFGRFAAKKRLRRRGLGQPGTFDFVGFTHKCGVSRGGNFILMRHSASKRMVRNSGRSVMPCVGTDTSRFLSKGAGWLKCSAAIPIITVFRPTRKRLTHSVANL